MKATWYLIMILFLAACTIANYPTTDESDILINHIEIPKGWTYHYNAGGVTQGQLDLILWDPNNSARRAFIFYAIPILEGYATPYNIGHDYLFQNMTYHFNHPMVQGGRLFDYVPQLEIKKTYSSGITSNPSVVEGTPYSITTKKYIADVKIDGSPAKAHCEIGIYTINGMKFCGFILLCTAPQNEFPKVENQLVNILYDTEWNEAKLQQIINQGKSVSRTHETEGESASEMAKTNSDIRYQVESDQLTNCRRVKDLSTGTIYKMSNEDYYQLQEYQFKYNGRTFVDAEDDDYLQDYQSWSW